MAERHHRRRHRPGRTDRIRDSGGPAHLGGSRATVLISTITGQVAASLTAALGREVSAVYGVPGRQATVQSSRYRHPGIGEANPE